ncbi:site-specific integrase [Eubacterium sp. AF15-50]|uniref:site-specific integrase n=1 Tax=unclassified Eubacterium (in: firmicutes) TaxID=2624479 RepID=UPI000E4B6D0E|nr:MULTISPECIES: site-specific integrase [unclassified Eubacterium (in: firmicutes)]RHR73614.1 site-specific integrase [Eubacterium sp. AF16-48]RHR81291.1 site-specific integrase [Eubacterium sp. AF15-50]
MSEIRKDSKGRRLATGESQDKDGRYRYKYNDVFGKRKSVYSWRLTESDPYPKGKRKDISLREKEKEVEKALRNAVATNGGNMTVLELVQKYISQKRGVKHNTQANYNFVINVIKKEDFGARRIDTIKLSDAKIWLIKLQDDGRGYSSIHSIRGVVRPAFQMAVDDDLINKNPFEFQLATVVVNDSVTREAITRKQQREFLRFIKEDKHFCKYYDGIYILFYTGLRVSEFVGLTINDIEFDKERIKVDHQLQRTRNMEYEILTPKTEKGERYVPMQKDVADCFRRIIQNRKHPKIEPMIDGYSGFLFLDKNDMPMVALHWEKYFQHIREKYNSIYKVQMPCITPHVCRHTFCSNMAKSGMNPKTLQYIMGHSDIGVTLNTYTHLQFEDALVEMKKVVG